MRTRRVTWPLLSQYVDLPASGGSSGAGWTSPSTAIAREVTVCSQAVGVPQSKLQKVQANSAPAHPVSVAGYHDSSSMRISTDVIN